MAHKMGLIRIAPEMLLYERKAGSNYIPATKTISVKISKMFNGNIPFETTDAFFFISSSTNPTFSNTSTSIQKWDNFTASITCGRYAQYTVNPSREYYFTTSRYNYTGSAQTFTTSVAGKYRFECWGSAGADFQNVESGETNNYVHPIYLGGHGGYTRGDITLAQAKTFYIFVGNATRYGTTDYTYNGGGYTFGPNWGANGGGASDIRLINGNWDYDAGLRSRIMVAGGGGSASDRGEHYGAGNGGYGGGLIAGEGQQVDHTNPWGYSINRGGTQTAGGVATWVNNGSPSATFNGEFGKGSNSQQSSAGSGWYGGGSGIHAGSGGGSSFISGHDGCRAVDSSTGSVLAGNVMTISGVSYAFDNTYMVDGEGYKWTTARTAERPGTPYTNGTVGTEYGYPETAGCVMISLYPTED